jgi:hypothetical protein
MMVLTVSREVWVQLTKLECENELFYQC